MRATTGLPAPGAIGRRGKCRVRGQPDATRFVAPSANAIRRSEGGRMALKGVDGFFPLCVGLKEACPCFQN